MPSPQPPAVSFFLPAPFLAVPLGAAFVFAFALGAALATVAGAAAPEASAGLAAALSAFEASAAAASVVSPAASASVEPCAAPDSFGEAGISTDGDSGAFGALDPAQPDRRIAPVPRAASVS